VSDVTDKGVQAHNNILYRLLRTANF